jgi:hypothetical protein
MNADNTERLASRKPALGVGIGVAIEGRQSISL